MAGSEVYRVEIPIIVDDQSEAPLTKARERVSKFEQAAQKTNQRIQRMAMTDYRLRLSVLDKAMPVVDKVGRTLKTMTTRAWNVTVGVKDKVTGFLGRIGRMLTTPLGMIGMGGLVLSPMALLSNAIKTASEFEQAMANVQSVTGASREEMDRLREAAAKAGRETVFKASEAADALYYLALAGFTVDQQIDALSGTLALAAATQSDLAFTSETIASTISAFGLEAEEADRVANVFAATIGSSQASIDKLAQSMRYAGPAAAGFGRSLEETAATLALFYNMGLTGEMAGTRFRTALSALAHPTGDTKNALAELGIKASQVNPAMHSLADIIDLLKDKGVDTAMAMRIFGQETGPAMASLIALGGNALRDMERQITGTNKALEMQEIQLDTLTGAQKELQSVWESVNITLGTQSIPGLRRLVEWLKETIGNADELAKKVGDKLNRAFEWFADIIESEEFKEADIIGKISILIEEGMPEIAETGARLGAELGKSIAKGLGSAIADDPYTALTFGILAGVYTPGPIKLKVGIAVSIAAIPWVKKFLEWLTTEVPENISQVVEGVTKYHTIPGTTTYTEAKTKEAVEAWEWFEEKSKASPPGEPLFPGTELRAMPKRAIGGIFSRPHTALVAEAGPEAIIPLTKPERAWSLWQQVGDRMGFFEREKVVYNIPTKLMQQRMTYNIPDSSIENIQTATITRKMSEPLDKLQKETRHIITRGQDAISKITSIFKRINTYQTRLATEVNYHYLGPTSYQPLVKATAAKFNIPAGILARLIQAESSWNPSAVSPAGAFGLTQVMPATARGMGYSVDALRRSPALQIEAGAKYLSQQYKRFGSWPLALAAYNAGPGAVSKYGGIPPYRETQNYVAKILSPVKYAFGGILTRPHMGLVAEAGPEAIIPLTSRMRSRALGLWEETGRRLGVRTPELALGGAGGSPISVTNYISVSVNSSNADPDEIAEAIAIKLERSYHNMPRN